MENTMPVVSPISEPRSILPSDYDDDVIDEFDSREIFDLIRTIKDPEYSLTLEELNIVKLEQINVNNAKNSIDIDFTPTIPHCSMAAVIGLAITMKLLFTLPPRFKFRVMITPGTHTSEEAINKQLADKERVTAALENQYLCSLLNKCVIYNYLKNGN